MVSYVRKDGIGAPQSGECFDICSGLERCTGVEIRNSDNWCELQIPTLARAGDGSVSSDTLWGTGSDAAAENLLAPIPDYNSVNSVTSSPMALTTANPKAGFYCWGKVMECSAAPKSDCEVANRYPCEESYKANSCGPCVPLTIAADGSDSRLPNLASSICIVDPAVEFPTLKIALGSPWFGGRGHMEVMYLAMIYGVKKAWEDEAGESLIPIPMARRMKFPMRITGHTDDWRYTLSREQLESYGFPVEFDTRMENHPMSGIRAMSSLMRDAWTTQYGLMESLDNESSRPHCVIGSTPDNSLSGVMPHAVPDLPLSHAATFYETPVIGWAFPNKEFADKTNHKYYMRMNRVGLDYQRPTMALIKHYNFKRIAVVTSGTNRMFVRSMQEGLDVSVELLVEDMGLEGECSDAAFEKKCHEKLITSMKRLRQQDARVIIHEQGGATQLENYWVSFADTLRSDTLLIQVGVIGDCQMPMLPPTDGTYGLDVLWESIRTASNANNRGEWDLLAGVTGGDCRVCPNWAFRDLDASQLSNRLNVAWYNANRTESIYGWEAFCPEMPDAAAMLDCDWCDPYADFWISPACDDEMEAMRTQLKGSFCIGVSRTDDDSMIENWRQYLAGLTAQDLVNAGAPAGFMEIFESWHPLFNATKITLGSLWNGAFKRGLKEKAGLLDSILLPIVAYNTWVRAAGDSSEGLDSTALRVGFRTVHNAAIVNWKATMERSEFKGLTGNVKFNSNSERVVSYNIFSAGGAHLAFTPVADFTLGDQADGSADVLAFTADPVFNDGSTTPPLDMEAACQPGYQYNMTARGCSLCPIGMYCLGDQNFPARIAAIACEAGGITSTTGMVACDPCPVGTKSNSERTLCTVCASGRHASEEGSGTCALCEAGRYWTTLEVIENQTLMLMGVGFGGSATVSSCEPCARGFFAESRGKTECTSCGGNLKTQATGSIKQTDCICDQGMFLDQGQTSCTDCPSGMRCPIGSDMRNYFETRRRTQGNRRLQAAVAEYPMLREGYFSEPDSPLSVYRCVRAADCPGGDPGVCAGGTDEIACANCPRMHYRQGEQCIKCNDFETSKTLFPVAPCLLMVPLIAVLYAVSRTPVQRWSTPKTGIIIGATVMLMHFQIQGLLWSFSLFFEKTSLGVTWGAFNALVEGLSILRPRCAGVDTFQETYYLNVAAPLFVIFCFALTLLSSRLLNLCGRRRDTEDADTAIVDDGGSKMTAMTLCAAPFVHVMDVNFLLSSCGAVMETFFVAIAKVSMSLFHCYEHPNGKFSLYIAPEILCDSDDRNSLMVVGVFAIIVYCVGGCALVAWVLYRAPVLFERESGFQKRWRFLLGKYRPDVHYWSAVLVGRSVVLSMTTLIFSEGQEQLLFVIIIMMVYGFAVNQMKPWRHIVNNVFDQVMSVMIIAAASAMFRFAADDQDAAAQEKINGFVSKYTQATNFIPLAIAMIVGLRLVYLHFNPKIQVAHDAKLAQDLERVSVSLASSIGGGLRVQSGIAILSEMDKETLSGAMHILLSESQMRLFNLRKSLGLQALKERDQEGQAAIPEPVKGGKVLDDNFFIPIDDNRPGESNNNSIRVLHKGTSGKGMTPRSVHARMDG